MIAWYWLIIGIFAGAVGGFFVAAMMAVRKISDMAETIEEQRRMRQEFERWNKWGKVR